MLVRETKRMMAMRRKCTTSEHSHTELESTYKCSVDGNRDSDWDQCRVSAGSSFHFHSRRRVCLEEHTTQQRHQLSGRISLLVLHLNSLRSLEDTMILDKVLKEPVLDTAQSPLCDGRALLLKRNEQYSERFVCALARVRRIVRNAQKVV